jgi:6-phosphofructokinase
VLSKKKRIATVWHGLGHVNRSCSFSVEDHRAGRVCGGLMVVNGVGINKVVMGLVKTVWISGFHETAAISSYLGVYDPNGT